MKYCGFITLLETMILSLTLLNTVHANEPHMPFPQAKKLKYVGIKPNYPQKQLNAAVTDYYQYWKSKYLVKSTKDPGDYKIAFNKKNWTVSEAMGYGMLITVQMAGYDPKAKKYFEVEVTAVKVPELDVEKFKQFAESLGVLWRLREYIQPFY